MGSTPVQARGGCDTFLAGSSSGCSTPSCPALGPALGIAFVIQSSRSTLGSFAAAASCCLSRAPAASWSDASLSEFGPDSGPVKEAKLSAILHAWVVPGIQLNGSGEGGTVIELPTCLIRPCFLCSFLLLLISPSLLRVRRDWWISRTPSADSFSRSKRVYLQKNTIAHVLC